MAGPGGDVRSVAADDAAIQLAYAQKVIIVPGYGLAAAQAQHQVAELAALLEERGAEVSYAIHPVAGRMPGHMNVLLAEANVPYPQLKEMEEINPEFPRADVALVIGANDVTNPAARRPGTAISGMPILDVDQAKSIIVIKRSMGHGYAGIDNELYVNPKTSMLFADAKSALTELIASVKTLVAGRAAPAARRPAGPRDVRGMSEPGGISWDGRGELVERGVGPRAPDRARAAVHQDRHAHGLGHLRGGDPLPVRRAGMGGDAAVAFPGDGDGQRDQLLRPGWQRTVAHGRPVQRGVPVRTPRGWRRAGGGPAPSARPGSRGQCSPGASSLAVVNPR